MLNVRCSMFSVCTCLQDADISLLRLIHHGRIEALDRVLYLLSYSASFVSIGIVLALLIVFLKTRSKAWLLIFYKMLTVLVIAALVSTVMKSLILRERPFVTYPDIEKLSQAGNSSFPSGHSLEAFAMAMALTLVLKKKRYVIPVFCWAVLVAYSRMALGVHYPGDVAGGIIAGTLIGWLIPLVIQSIISKRKRKLNKLIKKEE